MIHIMLKSAKSAQGLL